MVEKGANVDEIDSMVVNYVCSVRSVIELLLMWRCFVNLIFSKKLKQGKLELVKLLIEKGLDFTRNSELLLHRAASV